MFESEVFMTGVILASASPRRADLLSTIGLPFHVVTSGAEEVSGIGLQPDQTAIANARAKAHVVAAMAEHEAPIVGCDTVVSLGDEVFGKPTDQDDALRMLSALSGKTHIVTSGVCITDGIHERVFSEQTKVTFRDLTLQEIESYIRTGEPFDKAGAYGIQGKGMLLVDHIEGDYNNVVGLPVTKLVLELDSFLEEFPPMTVSGGQVL